MKYKDYKHLIICISIISLWLMILFFLGNIVNSKVDMLNNMKNQQQQELIRYYSFMEKNKNIDSYKEKIDFNLNLLNEKIPEEINEEKFLWQLNDMAKYSAVNIIEVIPKEKNIKDNLEQEKIELVLQGDFFAIVDFFNKLNLNNRLVTIQDSNIFIQNNTINAELTLQIYANN